MSANMPLERMVASWMTDEVSGVTPEALLEDILETTSHTRSQPRWLVLLKEPPMRLNSRLAVGSPARRVAFSLALALLVLAATAAVVGSFVIRTPTPPAADWPGFRGDAGRAGTSAQGPVGHPIQRWLFKAGGAVTNGTSIVGDLVYAASDDGVLHAIDLATGNERWSTAGGGTPLKNPIVANGLVYAFDGTGRLTAIDATTGQPRWTSPASVTEPTYPTIGGGRVYVGAANGALVAFDATTGAEAWQTPVSTVNPANSPAYADGLAYVASTGAGLFALDATTGKQVWAFQTGADQLGTAVVSDGIVYIGTNADNPTGRLWAIDAKTGTERWHIDEDLQAPAVADGVAYASSSSGLVAAIDTATGKERWHVQLASSTRAPAVAAGIVYVAADGDHRIYALDAATGGYLWRFDVDSSNECCVAVAHGSVFVGTTLGSVYDVGGDGTAISPVSAPSLVAAASSGPTASASAPARTAVAPEPVTFVAKATAPGGFAPNAIVQGPGGEVWVADPNNDRFAIFKPDGTFVEHWGASGSGDGQFDLTRSNGDGYGTIAFEPDGSFFVLDVGNRRVQAFDKHRSFIRAWGGFGTGPGEYNDPVGLVVAGDGTVFVLDDVRGVIEHDRQDGTVLGSFSAFANGARPGFNEANSLAIDAAGNLYVSDISPHQVQEFDPAGNLKTTFGSQGTGPGQFADQPGSMAIDAHGRVFVDQGPQRGDLPAITVFDAAGATLAGFGAGGSADGQIGWPTGLLLTGLSGIWVGDLATTQGPVLTGQVDRFTLLPPLAP